jgi:hypothetical protein
VDLQTDTSVAETVSNIQTVRLSEAQLSTNMSARLHCTEDQRTHIYLFPLLSVHFLLSSCLYTSFFLSIPYLFRLFIPLSFSIPFCKPLTSSGNYMYHLFQKSIIMHFAHKLYLLVFSNSINQLILVIVMSCAFCAVRFKFLNTFKTNFGFKGLTVHSFRLSLFHYLLYSFFLLSVHSFVLSILPFSSCQFDRHSAGTTQTPVHDGTARQPSGIEARCTV